MTEKKSTGQQVLDGFVKRGLLGVIEQADGSKVYLAVADENDVLRFALRHIIRHVCRWFSAADVLDDLRAEDYYATYTGVTASLNTWVQRSLLHAETDPLTNHLRYCVHASITGNEQG